MDCQYAEQKKDNSVAKIWAIGTIFSLSMLNPFMWFLIPFFLLLLFVFGLIGAAAVIAVAEKVGPYAYWIVPAVLFVSLLPPIRDRISGKYQVKPLEDRIAKLEEQLKEAKFAKTTQDRVGK